MIPAAGLEIRQDLRLFQMGRAIFLGSAHTLYKINDSA